LSLPLRPLVAKLKGRNFYGVIQIFFLHLCVFIAMIDVSGVALSTSSSANIAIKKDIRIIKFWISILQFF
jgi:hypothetical protein